MQWPNSESFGPVHFLPGADRGRYPDGNVVFVDGGLPTVLDPMSPPACQAIAAAYSVKQVYNSHFHEDHRAGNDLFPDAELWVPENEKAGYRGSAGYLELYGDGENFIPDESDYARWLAKFPGLGRTDYSGTYGFGDRLQWGDVAVEIVPLPGHSPGQSGFFFPEQRVMYIADVDLSTFGPWYGSGCSDIDMWLESLRRLSDYADRVDAWLTAHHRGAVKKNMRAEIEGFRAVIHARDHRLLQYVDSVPRTWDDIMRQEIVHFYPAKERDWVQADDRMMVGMHLRRLMQMGIVEQDGDYYLLSGRAALSDV